VNPYDIGPILRRILAVAGRASDIIFSPGFPPKVLLDGQLQEVQVKEFRALAPYQTEMLALTLLKDKAASMAHFLKTGSVDTSYTLENAGRFRVNIFKQRNTVAIVMRVIPTKTPSFESLGLPDFLKSIIELKTGIVLLTGPTGCGKSSTLASLISMMSMKYAYHIITIEDPIEFLYAKGRSMIHQRELGIDTENFNQALRTALRQAPQVIMVGEMRDRSSIEIALEAAETGHLIFSTLHTIDAAKTIERILGAFPKEQQNFVRGRFSQTFRYIISQRLLPRADGRGRALTVEALKSTERTRQYILKGHEAGGTLSAAMEDGATEGMQTFDMDLLRMTQEGVITKETALTYASNANNLALKMGMLKDRDMPKGKRNTDDSQTLDELPILGLDQEGET
jgi:twitching motility protein PilT